MSENLNVFNTRGKTIYGIYEKKKIILLFSCFSAPDVITDVVKQNRNTMTSTLSACQKEREKQINHFDTTIFLTN